MSKKKVFGILALVAVLIIAIIVAVVFIVKDNARRMGEYELEEIEEIEYKYFVLSINNKQGVIDTSGNIIVNADYDKIVIPNPKKAVFICSNEGDEKNTILNEKSEKIFDNYDNVEEIELQGLVTSLPYEKSVLKYELNGKFGLINLDGEKITKANYEEIKGLKYKEGELLAKFNGKYGVINIKGSKLISFDYDNIEADKYYLDIEKYKKSGYIVCKTTEDGYRYGYISNEGEKILETNYNDIKRVTDIQGEDIYLIASVNGQYGLLKNKENLIDFKYQDIQYNPTNNLLIINRGANYGVYTLTGKEVVPINYKTVQFNGIYIYAKTGNDIKYFTNNGEEVTNGFTSLVPVDDGKYYITIDENGLYGVVDKDHNVLIDNKFVYIEYMFDNYFSVYKNEKGLGIMDTEGREITDFIYTIINKISDTNLIKTEDMSNNAIEIYNSKLTQVARMENAEIDIRDTYIKLHNENNTIYIDNKGNIIDENIALSSTKESPEKIGEYVKEYMGYSQVYYTIINEEENQEG